MATQYRRLLWGLLVFVTVASGINYFRRIGIEQIRVAFAATRPVVPRTVVLIETSSNSQGESVSSRRTLAVRSDGSEVEISQSLDVRTGTIIREDHRLTRADRIIARWNPSVRSKSTRRSAAADFQAFFLNARRDHASRCLMTLGGTDLRKAAGEIDGGDETVNGIQAVKVMLKNSNQPEIHMWYAPELGCQLIQQVVQYQHAGSQPGPLVSGTSKLTLESVKLGEPAEDLFVIPAGFEEVLPSEFDLRVTLKVTGARRLGNPENSLAEDAKYLKQRP